MRQRLPTFDKMPGRLETLWFADTGNIQRLNELLNDPALQMALQVLREKGRPQGKPVLAESLLQANALENTRVYGWHEALDELEKLTIPRAKREKTTLDPYTEEAMEYLRERGLEPPSQKENP